MDYADVVLGAIVITYSLAIAVFVGIGADPNVSIGIGSVAAGAFICHALFVNPPT